MYTVIFKCKYEETAVFNVYDNKKRIIGNIFCTKKNGRYTAARNQKIPSVAGNEINAATLQNLYYRAESICAINFK